MTDCQGRLCRKNAVDKGFCICYNRFRCQGNLQEYSGDYGERVSPVPIPNTEVKPFSADGTWLGEPMAARSACNTAMGERPGALSA